MRYRNLEANEIRKIVTEESEIQSLEKTLSSTIQDIDFLLRKRFSKLRKLTDCELQQTKSALRAISENKGFMFASIKETKKTIGDSETQLCALSFPQYPNQHNKEKSKHRLMCDRVIVSRKRATLETCFLPAEFSYHVSERLLERSECEEGAYRSIAGQLMDWMPFTHAMKSFAFMRTGGHLYIPAKDRSGILLGTYEMEDSPGLRAEYNRFMMKRDETPLLKSMNYKFSVKTFVSFNMLTQAQNDVMHKMSDWFEVHSDKMRTATTHFRMPMDWVFGELACDGALLNDKMIRELITDPLFVEQQNQRQEKLGQVRLTHSARQQQIAMTA